MEMLWVYVGIGMVGMNSLVSWLEASIALSYRVRVVLVDLTPVIRSQKFNPIAAASIQCSRFFSSPCTLYSGLGSIHRNNFILTPTGQYPDSLRYRV